MLTVRVQHLLLLMISILLSSWEAVYSEINKMIFWFNCHCSITSVYSYRIRCYLCMSNKMSFPKGSWYSNNYDTTFLSVLLSKRKGTLFESTRLKMVLFILQANSGVCCTGRWTVLLLRIIIWNDTLETVRCTKTANCVILWAWH